MEKTEYVEDFKSKDHLGCLLGYDEFCYYSPRYLKENRIDCRKCTRYMAYKPKGKRYPLREINKANNRKKLAGLEEVVEMSPQTRATILNRINEWTTNYDTHTSNRTEDSSSSSPYGIGYRPGRIYRRFM